MAHVLVIDDDIAICEVIRYALAGQGHLVTVASSDDDIDGLARSGVGLVITELVLRRRSALLHLASLRQRLASVPIIAISGGSPYRPAAFYLALARRAGAAAALAKPFRISELRDCVDSCLRFHDY